MQSSMTLICAGFRWKGLIGCVASAGIALATPVCALCLRIGDLPAGERERVRFIVPIFLLSRSNFRTWCWGCSPVTAHVGRLPISMGLALRTTGDREICLRWTADVEKPGGRWEPEYMRPLRGPCTAERGWPGGGQGISRDIACFCKLFPLPLSELRWKQPGTVCSFFFFKRLDDFFQGIHFIRKVRELK